MAPKSSANTKEFFLTHHPWILFGFVCLVVVALNSSKAILSISVPGIAAVMLVYQGLHKWPLTPWSRYDLMKALLLVGIFMLAAISMWQTEGNWLRDVKSKLHFLAIPLGFVFQPKPSKKQLGWWAWLFIISQSVWALLTLIQFGFRYEELMLRVSQNGHIDIFGSISHIYFSLLLGFSAILGFDLSISKKISYRWLMLGLALFNFVALHILSSRTGQLACYAGILAWVLTYILNQKRYILGIGALALLMLTPILAYYTIPSFQARVMVSRWDYQQYEQGTSSLTDNSLSARLTVWRASAAVFQEHFWLGVGHEDVKEEITAYYLTEKQMTEVPEALSITHNLYLKYAVGMGVLGLLYLFAILLLPLFSYRESPISPLWLSFLAYCAVAMLFENILEREIGIVFFSLGYMLLELASEPESSPTS